MRSTPHSMAAATASQPEINIAMIIVRLICASSLPCYGRTRIAAVASGNSLAVAAFQAIDRKSPVPNQFALSNALDYRLELYRSGVATYDRQPSREWGCLAFESEQERD